MVGVLVSSRRLSSNSRLRVVPTTESLAEHTHGGLGAFGVRFEVPRFASSHAIFDVVAVSVHLFLQLSFHEVNDLALEFVNRDLLVFQFLLYAFQLTALFGSLG